MEWGLGWIRGSGWRSGLGGLPSPIDALCRGSCTGPPLLQAPQKGQLGFGLCIFSIICPNWPCTHLFLICYSIFVFCCPRDVCPGASTAVKGPRCQLVSDSPTAICWESASWLPGFFPLRSLPSAEGGGVWCRSHCIELLLTLPPLHEAPALSLGEVTCRALLNFPPPGTLLGRR